MRALPAIGLVFTLFAAATSVHANDVVDGTATDSGQLRALILRNTQAYGLLAKHFGLDHRAVLGYLGTLCPSQLKESALYTVYLPSRGDLKPTLRTLAKGTHVFADSSGSPVLLAKGLDPIVLSSVHGNEPSPMVVTSTGTDPLQADRVPWKPMATSTSAAVSPGLSQQRGDAVSSDTSQPPSSPRARRKVLLISSEPRNAQLYPGVATVVIVVAGVLGMVSRRRRHS